MDAEAQSHAITAAQQDCPGCKGLRAKLARCRKALEIVTDALAQTDEAWHDAEFSFRPYKPMEEIIIGRASLEETEKDGD